MSEKPTDQHWFVLLDGEQYGPYPFAALVEAAKKGIVRRRAQVWHPTWSKWRFAGDVPGLFEEGSSDHSDPILKSSAGGKLPEAPVIDINDILAHRPHYATVEPPPDRGRATEPASDSASPRRRGRGLLGVLTIAILCGAAWVSLRWAGIDAARLFAPLPPAAMDPVLIGDKSAKAPTTAIQNTGNALPENVAQLSAVVGLRRTDPAAFELFSMHFRERYNAEATDKETLTLVRTELRKSVKSLLAKSSDEAIFEITDVSLGYMRAMRDKDAASCVALSDESKGAKLTDNLARDFPEIFAQDMKALEHIASTTVESEIEIPTEQEVQAQLASVFAGLQVRSLQFSLFNKKKLTPAEFKPYCDLVIAFYEAVRLLPKKDSAKLLRYLYAAAAAEPAAKPTQPLPATE